MQTFKWPSVKGRKSLMWDKPPVQSVGLQVTDKLPNSKLKKISDQTSHEVTVAVLVFKLPWVPHFLSRQTWALITGSPGSTLPVLRIYSLPSMPVFGYFKRGFYNASMEQTLYGQVLVNKYYSLNRNQSFQTINIKMWAIESLWKCEFHWINLSLLTPSNKFSCF